MAIPPSLGLASGPPGRASCARLALLGALVEPAAGSLPASPKHQSHREGGFGVLMVADGRWFNSVSVA